MGNDQANSITSRSRNGARVSSELPWPRDPPSRECHPADTLARRVPSCVPPGHATGASARAHPAGWRVYGRPPPGFGMGPFGYQRNIQVVDAAHIAQAMPQFVRLVARLGNTDPV